MVDERRLFEDKNLFDGKSMGYWWVYTCSDEFSSLIRINKLPEPYKGKGIRYCTETVKLKTGKKI